MFRPQTPRDADRLSPRRGSQETHGGAGDRRKKHTPLPLQASRASGGSNSTRTPDPKGEGRISQGVLQETISRLGGWI